MLRITNDEELAILSEKRGVEWWLNIRLKWPIFSHG